MRRILLLILTIFCLLLFTIPVLAQDPQPDYDRINDIAEKLNCPTCSGLNLADCRTLTCEQWRDKIGELVDQGYNNQEVLDYFSTRYGTQVLQEPPRSGFTLLLWVLPVMALLIGGGWLFY
ncbi:MAG: cytochrome c-type biogenesis protein, partial [Chloroflexota bacterium]